MKLYRCVVEVQMMVKYKKMGVSTNWSECHHVDDVEAVVIPLSLLHSAKTAKEKKEI